MEKIKLVKKGEVQIESLIDELKKNSEAHLCGAIVAFIGITRGIGQDGSELNKLHYETANEMALHDFKDIRAQILKENKHVKDLMIYHVIDDLKPGEDTVYILALGEHRKETFNATIQTLERIKETTPIWKKEYTEEQSYWVSEKKVL